MGGGGGGGGPPQSVKELNWTALHPQFTIACNTLSLQHQPPNPPSKPNPNLQRANTGWSLFKSYMKLPKYQLVGYFRAGGCGGGSGGRRASWCEHFFKTNTNTYIPYKGDGWKSRKDDMTTCSTLTSFTGIDDFNCQRILCQEGRYWEKQNMWLPRKVTHSCCLE